MSCETHSFFGLRMNQKAKKKIVKLSHKVQEVNKIFWERSGEVFDGQEGEERRAL